MYRQVLVDKEQTSLQSILWREDPKEELQEFELLTLTYGTRPASFLAVKCLHQLAEIERINHPRAVEVLSNNFYIDDLLTGSNTREEIFILKQELTELLGKGGFRLHKWRSNVDAANDIQFKNLCVDIIKEESKLLGVLWNPQKDIFQYEVTKEKVNHRVTKRTVLSQICKLFDPLGLAAPVLTSAKILMQSMWNSGIKWDESVPMHIHKEWEQIRSQLNVLNELRIPRLVVSGEDKVQLQLHGFCDASEKAYGACVYVRERNEKGKVVITLICSKLRVAPMKTLSTPLLELCATVLLTGLMSRVLANLKLKIEQRFYWTDSKIVLAWIKSFAKKWHVFVANRVSEIHNNSSPSEWRHVGSKDNPADLVSRGATPEQLVKANIWWCGPQWLRQEAETWPGEGIELLKNVPEERKQTVITVATNRDAFIEYKRFSSLYKLMRVVAYILRFISNIRNNKESRRIDAITAGEISAAKLAIIKLVQFEEFSGEIKTLRSNEKMKKSSTLITLSPFLDDNEVLRVGGRLKHAALSEEAKHPAILPSHHYFTRLIIIHYHEKLLHAGVQTTLSSIREEFWPTFARSRIKEILHKCVKCRKASPKAS